ncbi:uncharacterized protein [Antedon mediterranea]|uniref:uncharacterized protein n=1 Tax=Antedon mediterranea TaxID=105859 RepID=UPI003AF541FC
MRLYTGYTQTMYSILQNTCIVLFLSTLAHCKLHCSKDPDNLMLGDFVTLTCKKDIITENDSFRLVWKSLKTQAINTDSYVLSTGQTAKLVAKVKLTEEDNYQKFTCKERRDQQTADMCEVTPLKIASEVMVTASLQPTYQTANVTFSCEAKMLPIVSRYSWSFDGNSIQDGGRFQILNGGKTLIVQNVLLDDHKKIATCTSFNRLGLSKSGSNIVMIDPEMIPPSMIKSDKDLFILGIGAGFSAMAILVVIFCIVAAIVKKNARKNSKPLTDSDEDEETACKAIDGHTRSKCNPYASSDLGVSGPTSMSERCQEKERQLDLEAESDQERRYFTLEKPDAESFSKPESLYASIEEERL